MILLRDLVKENLQNVFGEDLGFSLFVVVFSYCMISGSDVLSRYSYDSSLTVYVL